MKYTKPTTTSVAPVTLYRIWNKTRSRYELSAKGNTFFDSKGGAKASMKHLNKWYTWVGDSDHEFEIHEYEACLK